MESQQLHRPRDYAHTHDDDLHKPSGLHSMVEDEGEHHDHHEKKSVLKKVKAKAKKIKDTITKHGHGHEHEHDRDHHQNEEYEDEDEEMDEDPEIHGAPVYESAAISRVVPDHGINVGNPTAVGEDSYGTRASDRVLGMPSSQGQEQYPMQSGISLERPMATTGIVHTPEDEQQGIGGLLHNLKEDPNYARPGTVSDSNYETKITDPTGKGGQEAEVTSLINALDNTRISDESVSKQSEGVYTGSHDQFAPQSYPTADEFAPRSVTGTTDESIPKSYNASSSPEELPQDTFTGKSPHNQRSGYIGKISNATTAIADKAISAKNVVASKLGYGGGNEGGKTYEIAESKNELAKPPGSSSSSPTEYAHRVAATVTEKLAPVYDKVADTGTAVIAKVKGSTTNAAGRGGTTEGGGGEGKVADKGVSVTEYLSEKLKPGDEDRALSEVISETLHNKKKEGMGKAKEEDAAGPALPPLGKVTESEEVARRLGSGTEKPREGDEAIAAGSESTGKGVVDRIKNAVNLWVSKGNKEDQQPGLLGKGNSVAGETEERKLQESVN